MQRRNNRFLSNLFLAAAVCGMLPIAHAENIVYDSGGRRDPFSKLLVQPGPGAAAVSVSGHLEGIIYDPAKQSFAIFDGETYRMGEKVGDAMIKKILKESVVVVVNGEEKTLRIREEEKNSQV